MQHRKFQLYKAFGGVMVILVFFMLPHVVNCATTSTNTAGTQCKVFTCTCLEEEPKQKEGYSEPHFKPDRSVIVELFEWKFEDVGKECTNFLGPKGYAGVQLSPVTEHIHEGIDVADGGISPTTWSVRYQPISYKFATRSGSVEEFLAMSRACNDSGVRVYLDVVLNHMASGDYNSWLSNQTASSQETLVKGTAGSEANIAELYYPGVKYDKNDFHEPCELKNYMNASEVRNCQWDGRPDLDQSKKNVRNKIVAMLNEMIDMGVAGFRIDGAKYMAPEDLRAIYDEVNDLNTEFDFPENARPFFYQEVVDLGMENISKTEYSPNGVVTDYLYAAELSIIFNGKVALNSLINWGPSMGFLPHQDALVFVNSHDSQHGALTRELGRNELLSFKQRRRYVMATAFMLLHPYGRIKRIMSSYYFSDSNKEQGPPLSMSYSGDNDDDADADIDDNDDGDANADADGHIENKTEIENVSIRSPDFDANEQCIKESGWVCEHRWPALVNLMALINSLNSTTDGVFNFQTHGPNHIAFCRGQKAFIALNNDPYMDYTATVHTCLEPGIYCDVISGGCMVDGTDCYGKRMEVRDNGLLDLMLPAYAGSDKEEIQNDVRPDNHDAKGIENENVFAAVDDNFGVIAIYLGSKLGAC